VSPAAAGSAIANTQTYRANRQGHIVLEAAVNGAPVKFLLDTGATVVVLTISDAAAAGIGRSSLSFTGRANTANGVIRTAPVTLREVRLGQFSAENVSAAVIENLETSLLGVSFLKRLQSYEMREGVLTITW
jgi:aspartyl protease family protein